MNRLARAGLALAGVVALAGCNGCGKRTPSASGAASAPSGPAAVPTDPVVKARMSEAWTRAADGDAEELAALALSEGVAGLEEGAAADAAHKRVALRAMAYTEGLAGLRFLAEHATSGVDEEATIALASAVELAARPRTATDAEDGDVVRAACDALGALARDAGKGRTRRVGALRVVRMLSDPGLGPKGSGPCAHVADLPADLDAK